MELKETLGQFLQNTEKGCKGIGVTEELRNYFVLIRFKEGEVCS